jgi:exodeoxyribonuclease VII large subunit
MTDKPSSETVLTPTTVAEHIEKNLFTLGRVSVEGEVSGAYKGSSVGTYFNLKDKKSILKAVLWADKAKHLKELVENGVQVMVQGYLRCYGPRSEYQINVESLMPKGEGNLRKAYELLKEKLTNEGLFTPERKRPLPMWPKRVALLTSESGAAVEDFIKTAVERWPLAYISLFPVKVQGPDAAREISETIASINSWNLHDLIVITRGGGSLEDLWAFNEEPLIRAVAYSRIPTLAAIGHSTDISLTELAADLKAITPTAAAEVVFPSKTLLLSELKREEERLAIRLKTLIDEKKTILKNLSEKLFKFPPTLENKTKLLKENINKLVDAIRNIITKNRIILDSTIERLKILSPSKELERRKEELTLLIKSIESIKLKLLTPFLTDIKHATERLELVSPLAILKRGYSLATTMDGKVIKDSSILTPGDPFRLTLSNGRLQAQVLTIDPSE